MSYGRMREKTTQLRDEVAALLAQAEAADAAEDATYGADRRGDELPAELKRREDRLARIKEAKRALEAQAKAEASDAGTSPTKAKPLPKAQYNFTDPESRIMKTPEGFAQAYNTQIAVDDLQWIVGQCARRRPTTRSSCCPCSRPSPGSRARCRRRSWPMRAIVRRRASWPPRRYRSTRMSPRVSRSTASALGPARADAYRRRPRSSTA